MSRMPVLFVGHGSPLNAIEDNAFTRNWKELAGKIPQPAGIVMVSAHWYTPGTRTHTALNPRTVYDMYGFPAELYRIVYPAAGAPQLAERLVKLLSADVRIDNSWGFDHGNWSVLVHMYPRAEVPLIQLSIDYTAPAAAHYKLGQELKALRDEGILIIGSGNVVHNLGGVRFDLEGGYDWAYEFDNYVKERILAFDHQPLLDYQAYGEAASLAVPTPDHYLPLLYVLGASDNSDPVYICNDSCVFGTLSMTCYLLGA